MKTLIVLLLFSTSLRPATVVEGAGYFPVMIKLKNGDALSVYRAGAAHVGVKGRLDMVRSTDGGKTWSTPWIAVDGEFDHRNPALGQLKDGTIVLAYSIASNYDATGLQFKGTRKDRVFDGVYLVRSKDDGKTWTEGVLKIGCRSPSPWHCPLKSFGPAMLRGAPPIAIPGISKQPALATDVEG